MTPLQFVEKWRPIALTERASAQSHFNDLCDLLDHPKPLDADPTGERFTFEKGVKKSGGGEGFADVWKKEYFAWEYKKRKRNLDEALGQLARYALALENPPLHVVCDTDRLRIVTAWTNTVPKSYELTLEDILDHDRRSWLQAAFFDPEQLKPGGLRSDLTKDAADKFSAIAHRLLARSHRPEDVAHFVNRLVFLFFAEDIKILPNGYFRKAIREMSERPRDANDILSGMFSVLHKGGRYGLERLPHVNGGLFDNAIALPLDLEDVALLDTAGKQDWAHIDPSIFGTLFERFLNPEKRSQIGAHYTDMLKIKKIVGPVIVEPLREEANEYLEKIETYCLSASKRSASNKQWSKAEEWRSTFLEKLRNVTVLDPACGSGNFLYVALQEIKSLEHAFNQQCESLGLPPRWPMVGPEILKGIEINPVAAELARTTIWIGEIQWGAHNGFNVRPEPILRTLDSIECRDALILSNGGEAAWPHADFIVGNPPFLGASKFLRKFGANYTQLLRSTFRDKVPATVDLSSYWFEKAASAILAGATIRAGLVSTNSVRQNSHRSVTNKLQLCGIFCAWSDEPWINEGAAVNVSLICFGANKSSVSLDGQEVAYIGGDLTPSSDAEQKGPSVLSSNKNRSFQGSQKIGPFDVPGAVAKEWLALGNPNLKPNSDVLKPLWNGIDVTRSNRDMWVVDFGTSLSLAEAELYEAPFKHVLTYVKPEREKNNREQYRRYWWRHGEPRVGMRKALSGLNRYIAISEKSKHFFFVFVPANVLPDKRLIVIARDDYTTFGIVSSKAHEIWSKKYGSTLEDRPCYTPSTCFETFPFPEHMSPNGAVDILFSNVDAMRIAKCAEDLDALRKNWLGASDSKPRTLTRLYNEYPSWLESAHRRLDSAVLASYGWSDNLDAATVLENLTALNAVRSAASLVALAANSPSTAATQVH